MASAKPPPSEATFPSIHDPSSVANFSQVVNTHFDLQLEVDFEAKTIHSTAVIHLLRKPEAAEVVLDAHKLHITGIWTSVNSAQGRWTETSFDVQPFASFGSALHIPLPAVDGKEGAQEVYVKIEYDTDCDSTSVCWMEPPQTAGKDYNYLFTQGQSVLNRSFFPCQDSPCVRITYTASVYVAQPYTALMSAARLSTPGSTPSKSSDLRRFDFEMRQSIPSYLVALVVGNLVAAKIGPRSHVWTEPAVLDKCKHEFEGSTEKFLSVGESVFGPYLWELYDLVVMPPGFPYGGMENPRLTFVSPCLVVGDRSLIDTVVHEVAHSWFGNLTTNATWSDFFLNEGFTMYAQRRITLETHGAPLTHLEAMTGWHRLKQEIKRLGEDFPLTRLRVPIEPGQDPEDTYNEVPYEKGYAFVAYLRSVVGTDEAFDGWLKSYVEDFQFSTVTAEDMLSHFLRHFPKLAEEGIDHRPGYEFDTWLYKPGMPPYTPDHSAGKCLTDPADTLVERIHKGDIGDENPTAGWPTYQICYLLDRLLDLDQQLDSDDGRRILERVGQAYGFADSQNAEVSLRWSQLVIKNHLMSALPHVENFLRRQGKQNFTVSVYRALKEGNDDHRKFAHRVFDETRHYLHIEVREHVEKVLKDCPDDGKRE